MTIGWKKSSFGPWIPVFQSIYFINSNHDFWTQSNFVLEYDYWKVKYENNLPLYHQVRLNEKFFILEFFTIFLTIFFYSGFVLTWVFALMRLAAEFFPYRFNDLTKVNRNRFSQSHELKFFFLNKSTPQERVENHSQPIYDGVWDCLMLLCFQLGRKWVFFFNL